MRFLIRDGRDPHATPLALSVGRAAGDVTLAELVGVVASRHPGFVPSRPRRLDIDGVPADPDQPVISAGLRAGSALTVDGPGPPAPEHRDGAPRVELRTVAGPGSGRALALPAGTFTLTPTGPDPGSAALTLTVRPDGDHAVTIEGALPLRVDGCAAPPGRPVPLAPGSVITAARSALRLVPRPPTAHPHTAGPTDHVGRRPLIRTPRVARPVPELDVPVPEPPAPPVPAPPLSWLVLLAPVPVGIVMAAVFSPFFLLMTMMSPCMGLARWVEGRHRERRDEARRTADAAAAAEAFTAAVEHARTGTAEAARHAHPDLCELTRRAVTGRQLWEVTPDDGDHLQVMVGVGPRDWRPVLAGRGDALARQPDLARVLHAHDHLADVPVLASLRGGAGLGAVGAADAAASSVAAALADLVTRHGPAHLRVALLATPDRAVSWEWTKWLPHLGADDGSLRVATNPVAAAELLDALEAAPRPRATAVVVDGDDLLTGAVASRLGRLARAGDIALVATRTPRRLPAVCQYLVELDRHGTATVTDAATGRCTAGVLPARLDLDSAEHIARALAGWSDPEQPVTATTLPADARLVDVLRTAAAGPDGLGRAVTALDAATIGRWWRRPPADRGLPATIGVTEEGPLALDLQVDGPHALVVGTTGAGKSELLRSLVLALACRLPPDELTFLLVDFKGGGAFDACAALPHTVGLVTDLDEHLAARALRCLRAELRHRERSLRDAGVSDRRDLLDPAPPLPRLVIVIDEFATLAAELPGFLSALVDVAQRGRSLGLHLVLATQRPQGVVDGKIRANTNLRVALRVQDEVDSRDVLGTRHAADIDRRTPGRAYVRLGAGEVVAVQAAQVSAPTRTDTAARVEVEPFTLVPPDPPCDRVAMPDGGPTDLEELAAAIAGADRDGRYEPPRVPCPPPLPEVVDAWTLPDTGTSGEGDGVALGVVDLPDEQRTATWCWRPEAGGTLLLGAEGADVSAALTAAVLGLCRSRHPDRQRIAVLDGAGHGLGALAALPHLTACVGADDAERLTRVLDGVDAEVARRRATGATGHELLVVVAGWGAVVDGAERAGVNDPAGRLERTLRDGAAVGVRLLVSASHERGVPARLLAQLPTKLVLRLADATGYTALGLRARDVPDLRGMRAVELATGHELQIGRYGDGTAASLPGEVARVAARYPDARPTPPVGVLPEVVGPAEVVAASTTIGTTWRLGVGRRYRDLAVATIDLAPGMHLVVAGPPRSGRTGTLRLLVASARRAVAGLTVRVVAADPASWGSPDHAVDSLDALTGWPPSGPALLVVDGVEALGAGAPAALDRLIGGLPPAVHVAVAGRVEVFRGLQPWQRALAAARTGLLLGADRDDGDILRVRLPREAPLRAVPGRGYLVEGGEPEQVQVGHVPAVGVPAVPPPAAVPEGVAHVAGSMP